MTRETIRKRINALRERTTARGCTEAEAMAAAEKAAELMRDHGLSGDDLAMGEDFATVKESDVRHRQRLWGVIATSTNTAALIRRVLEGTGMMVVFVGREPGPEISAYLVDVCQNAIAAELARFRKGDFYRGRRKASTKRKAVADFTVALVERLCHRIFDLFADSRDQALAARARAEFDRRYPNTTSQRATRKHKVTFQGAADAGWSAGGRVHLGHGVRDGSGSPLLIGGN